MEKPIRLRMTRWFDIEGTVEVTVPEDVFNQMFLEWFESKGWLFSGVIQETEWEDEEDEEE